MFISIYLGGVFLLSANSANLIRSVFVAKGYTIKTFLEVLTRLEFFSCAKSEINKRLENQNPFSPPLEINFGNRKLTVCNIATSTFNCTAISTTFDDSKEILSIEILFCTPSNSEQAHFDPAVSLTCKLKNSSFQALPIEASSLIRLFINNSIVQKSLPSNYPINFNNFNYDSIMLLLNAHKKLPITDELASELTERRKEKGYTQSQLAELSTNFLSTTDSPLTSLTISRIETKKINTVEIEKLYLLERTLQLPHGYFESINNATKKIPEKPNQEINSSEKKGNGIIYSKNNQESKHQNQEMHLNIAFCTQCGAKILRAGDKFCSRCGAQLPIEEAKPNVSVSIKQENVLPRSSNQGRPSNIMMMSQSMAAPRKKGYYMREKSKASLRKTNKF